MSHHPLPTDDELLRQMIPDDCFWLAPVPGLPVSTLADNASNYAAFLDFSHRLNQQDWIHNGGSIPQELQAALIEQPVGTFVFHENHCSLLEDKRDIVNDTESSCSSNSSADSSNYPCSGGVQDEEKSRESSVGRVDDSNEPENLSSRNSFQDNSSIKEKSTSSEETEEKTKISTT